MAHRRVIQRLPLGSCLLAGLLLTGCIGGGGQRGSSIGVSTGVHLQSVHYGRLVDVYGLRTIGNTQIIDLFQSDMIVGLDIQDERDSTSRKRDDEILYDFISVNPDSLQSRLFITREIGSEEFVAAVDALDENVRLISPSQFGRDTSKAPYSVVPRNPALRLTFSGDLGIDDSFFYKRDGNAKIIGKNSEAVQLLQIVGDPNDKIHSGDFKVIDTRVAVRGNVVIVDPVLLGTEGLTFGARNSASGMPAAPNQTGANIRLAIALEGPLSIGKISKDTIGSLSGRNNGAFNSIIRDFRSGNADDKSADLSRGFIRDPQPPRLIGQMPMYLERVEEVNSQTKLLTIFKDGIEHELDRSDQLRIFSDTTGLPVASLEILQDPADDLGKPQVQRVRVLVRPVLGGSREDVLESIDPSNLPGFPVIVGPGRDRFVREHAPRLVLIAEFTQRRPHPDPASGVTHYGDDPRNFISFSPPPRQDDDGGAIAKENVSPFAGAIIRFNKPIDMATLIALDTAFFANRNLLDEEAVAAFIKSRNIEPTNFNKEKFKTPHLIHSRIFDQDGSQTAIRVQPTLGFFLDQVMRDAAVADKALPFDQRRYHYFLHLVGGTDGIADLSGNSLDLQSEPIPGLAVVDQVVMEFAIETRNRADSKDPRFEDNIVGYVVRRFTDR